MRSFGSPPGSTRTITRTILAIVERAPVTVTAPGSSVGWANSTPVGALASGAIVTGNWALVSGSTLTVTSDGLMPTRLTPAGVTAWMGTR